MIERLRQIVGEEQVTSGRHIRCAPRTVEEVAAVLHAAAEGGVKVSVGAAGPALIHLDLGRLRAVLSVDAESLWCEVQAGATLLEAETRLRGEGLTLGPLPPDAWGRSVGAVLAAPRPGEAAPQHGRLRDRPGRVFAVVPGMLSQEAGLPVTLAPRRASGPDLKQLLIGSRGRIGVITSASLAVARVQPVSRCAGWVLPAEAAGCAALLEVLRGGGGTGPTDLQLMDRALLDRVRPPDAALPPGAVALLVRADGLGAVVEAELRRAAAACAALPAGNPGELPEALVRAWLAPELAALGTGGEKLPPRQAVLPPGSAEELAAAFAGAKGARLICGVHLHGAALYSEGGPAERPVAPMQDLLLRAFSEGSQLCGD